MKIEFKLQTITHNTKNISRITKTQAEFLAGAINRDLETIIDNARESNSLDGVKTKLTTGMFLIVIALKDIIFSR